MESTYSTELWLSDTDELHPDSELQGRIWDALHARHIGDGGGLFIYVTDQMVTLTGCVDTEHQAIEVAELVTRISDVRGIVNDLQIGGATPA